MELTSKPCTSREQGEKLMGLGLKKETADMVWHHTNSRSEVLKWELRAHPPTTRSNFHGSIEKLTTFSFFKKTDGSQMTGDEIFEELWGKDIPAWSLNRLRELLPKVVSYRGVAYYLMLECEDDTISYCSRATKGPMRKLEYFYGEETIYDNIIKGVRWLITEGYFNKEYLDGEHLGD